MSQQTHLKVGDHIFMFFTGRTKGNKKINLVPLWKKHKNIIPYFQMCLMARLKTLATPKWNLGSDIKLQSSTRILIDVHSQTYFDRIE